MLIDIQQGTLEWLELRTQKIGSSDVPIIMGASTWKTPLQLWEEKLGLKEEPPMNGAMIRGVENETKAIQYFEKILGKRFYPKVFLSQEFDWMIASLDGITEDLTCFIEVKCAGANDHMTACMGQVPEKYYPQLQHQMFVTGLSSCFYGSFDIHTETGHFLEVKRDKDYIKHMIEKEIWFKSCLDTFTPPDSSFKDHVVRRDEDFIMLANKWKEVNANISQLKAEEDTLRESLLLLCNNQSAMGAGVKITQYAKKGTINYKKIPELKKVNLDSYRSPDSLHWRFTTTTNKRFEEEMYE